MSDGGGGLNPPPGVEFEVEEGSSLLLASKSGCRKAEEGSSLLLASKSGRTRVGVKLMAAEVGLRKYF